MKQQPALAKWLLGRFSSNVSDSLLGDLQEEYETGRSTWWYWKQVVNAILVSTGRVLRHHPLQAALAIGVGWGLLWIYFAWLFFWFVNLDEELFVRGVVDLRGWWPSHWLVPPILGCLGCAVTGRAVGQFHRREIVLIYAATVVAWNVTIFPRILYAYVQDPSADGFFATTALHFVFMPLSILLGGLVATSPLKEQAFNTGTDRQGT